MSASCVSRVVAALVVAASLCTTASAQELNWAQKMFEKLDLDFGVVARGADVTQRVRIRNLYKEVIQITNVSTSCGCSAAKPSAREIPSGQEVYIEISMDTHKFMREKTSSVLVTLSEPTKNLRQEVKIPLKVYIRTDVVFTPGSANFGAVDLGSAGERKLTVAYAGRNDWKIHEIRSNKPFLEAAAVETSRPGNGTVNYSLIVKVKPDAPQGVFRETLMLMTDDQANPQVPLLVEGRVEPDIVVADLVIGTVNAGQSKTMNLVVRGKKPFKIEKIEGTNPGESFKVKLPADEKQVHVLPITFTAPAEASEINETFTIVIPGRPEPVSFKATGKVIAGTTGT